MKRKYIAVLTGAFVGMSVFSGCAGTNKDAKTEVQVTATEVQDDTDEEKAKEVVGEVEKVEDSTITLKTETQGEEDAKEIEITVTENTVIQKQSGGALEPPQGDEGKKMVWQEEKHRRMQKMVEQKKCRNRLRMREKMRRLRRQPFPISQWATGFLSRLMRMGMSQRLQLCLQKWEQEHRVAAREVPAA